MTVGTEDPEIREAIVLPPAVDVVELQWDRNAVPCLAETRLTSTLLQTLFEEPLLQRVGCKQPPIHEQFVDGSR